MTRKKLLLIAVGLVLLGGIYYYLYRDWFASEDIQIFHRLSSRQSFFRRGRPTDTSRASPIFFGFNKKFALTSVKVVPVSDIATNKYPHPIWELVSDSNSIPTKGFSYGMPIPGMRPSVPGARPDPLEPNVKYRLFVEADSRKGEHDFSTPVNSPTGR